MLITLPFIVLHRNVAVNYDTSYFDVKVRPFTWDVCLKTKHSSMKVKGGVPTVAGISIHDRDVNCLAPGSHGMGQSDQEVLFEQPRPFSHH